ncbi:MAG: aminomethyl-transferring glycine dehydrogenase subunit GcvPA, partial [Candidatus Heimdallarchaeota archaeon]|nr:aminomethyl-transferring glycine dehydrogenase subunit GcvPA [Candidatus Heimdallarchaeota archaeon]MCK5049528.1 aminomethyl-transferring glycine dehydrogenase subunit GcvPA [Candidatus Heimdallarchaeota archaeon]
TAYTPYQPECSQGWLQSIFEYQTALCELTGLDVSNASLYDGGTALYEAAMMAVRITGKPKVIVDSGVNLLYRSMLYSYTSNLDIEFIETPVVHGQSSREDICKLLDDKTAAVIFQNPNFFGVVDDHSDLVKKAHDCEALVIQSVYPIALGIMKTPAEMDVDIVTGEGQSLGLPLSSGGPYLGFMAVKQKFVRKMPGRIVGQTEDKDGKRGFVLTLQTREQHIRREKATSNICSNQSLTAISSAIYLALLGPKGLEEISYNIYNAAHYMAKEIAEIDGIQSPVHSGPFFHEFVIDLTTSKTSEEFDVFMVDRKILAGIPLEAEEGHIRRLIGAHEFTCRESVEKLLNALYAFMEAA